MSWTAQVIEETVLGNGYEKAVVLSDGTIKFVQRYRTDGTLADLRAQVLSTITAQGKQGVGKNETPIGTSINTTPDVVTVTSQTQAQIDAATFSTNVQDLKAVANAVTFGLTTKIDAAAAKSSAQALLDTYGAALTGRLANG